jgi:DNA-binding beta-propeller fold protein YncE
LKKSLAIFSTLFVVLALEANAQNKLPLKLIATIPLPDLVGDLEFFAPDLKGNRLFLCAENSKTVEVFDLLTGKRIHTITGFGEPHDIVYLPDTDHLIVTDGGDDFGWVERVSAKTYLIVDKIKLPNAVDEAVLDPVNKYFYEKLYVNNSGTSEIAVVDLRTRQVIARWPLPEAHNLNGLAFDEANHRLFSATRNPPKFWVFDTITGQIVTTLTCTAYNDHMIFDPVRKRIYITGTETASVIEQRDADHYENIAEVPTGYRAKTSIFVPELNRIYIALSAKPMPGTSLTKPGAQPAIKIYQVQP